MEKIAVLDSGGQYCHLIARKVRELGVYAEILPLGTTPKKLDRYKGVIISGGPASVFEKGSPRPKPSLFGLGRPMLGICYGHQLMAKHLDGELERGNGNEYGRADLRVRHEQPLFAELPLRQRVWMSHGDHVTKLPPGFETLGDTRQCSVAAMGDLRRHYYGLQFHPEVVHTAYGAEILRNFLLRVCRCRMDWHPEDSVVKIFDKVRRVVKDRRVLFFLSGGVDSTVAYALTVKAIGPERVHGVYVDTGFMRLDETREIQEAFSHLGYGSLDVVAARGQFLSGLRDIVDPEKKRQIIGRLFVDVQEQVVEREEFGGHDWILGQGTIYPDRIESGVSANSAVIKTHHNRVDGITKLIEEGRILEPLEDFYKDEVRKLGRVLGLPDSLVWRHPFPGPGLAIRCLCTKSTSKIQVDSEIDALAKASGYRGFLLPIRSVGVQGDSRSYAKLTVLHGGSFDFRSLLPLATAITNKHPQTNRVAVALAPKRWRPGEWKVRRATLTRKRISLLQEADRIVTKFLRNQGLYSRIWQCPVVLAPLSRSGGETIALRPVTSIDGMTAEAAQVPSGKINELARELMALNGVDAVLYDLSHKPPSTIEWE
jgi:GMP synthase (glutamine-hydrolysing)